MGRARLDLQIQGVHQGVGKDGARSTGRRFPPRSNWDRLRLYTHRNDLCALNRARKLKGRHWQEEVWRATEVQGACRVKGSSSVTAAKSSKWLAGFGDKAQLDNRIQGLGGAKQTTRPQRRKDDDADMLSHSDAVIVTRVKAGSAVDRGSCRPRNAGSVCP